MTAPSSVHKLRPWYFLVAMSLMWVMGVFGATSGCSEISYLRGADEMPRDLEQGIAEADNPLLRRELVRQRERLEQLAVRFRVAFPLSAGHMLLCVMLMLASGAAIAGRRGGRTWALQAVLANAVFTIIAFAAMTPARQAVIEAVARDAVTTARGLEGEAARQQLFSDVAREQRLAEHLRTGLELAVYALAALSLTRRRTRDYFEAVEEAVADAESQS